MMTQATPNAPVTIVADGTQTASENCLPLGTRLAEFEINSVLGEGGFGIVYRALDHSLQRTVAIKEYMPGTLARRGSAKSVEVRSKLRQETFDAGLGSFIHEARLLAQFDHPALVKVYRFWEENQTGYMAMHYYEGRTLKIIIDNDPTPATETWLKFLLKPILEALDALHQAQVLHSDISPDNIIIQKNGAPVLLDFGSARHIIDDMAQTLAVTLKPTYAPIEQYADDASMKQGPWSDIYSLSAVVYSLIAKKPPPTSVARTINDSIEILQAGAHIGFSTGFLAAVDKGLAVSPENRPQSIEEFRMLLGIGSAGPADASSASISPTVTDGKTAADEVRPSRPTKAEPSKSTLRESAQEIAPHNAPSHGADRIKIVNERAQVDGRLVRAKLLGSSEESLGATNMVTPEKIWEDAKALLKDGAALSMLRTDKRPNALLEPFVAIHLPRSIALKLTLAREPHSPLYQHSLKVALFALHLATLNRLDYSSCVAVAEAALLHDIGMLHVDPALVEPGHKISLAERQHIFAHPLSAQVMLDQYAHFHPVVSRAVAEHHERMDGTGYPRGLTGAQISPIGRILMLAEIAAVFVDQSGPESGIERLAVALKLNARRFDPRLAGHLMDLSAQRASAGGQSNELGEPPRALLEQFAAILSDWDDVFASLQIRSPRAAEAAPAVQIEARLVELRQILLAAGLDLDEPASLFAIAESDRRISRELQFLARESLWCIREIVVNIVRRSHGKPAPDDEAVRQWIVRTAVALGVVLD